MNLSSQFTEHRIQKLAWMIPALICWIGLGTGLVDGQEISFRRPASSFPVVVSAESATTWQTGEYDILHLEGSVQVKQGELTASATEAIFWVEVPEQDAGSSPGSPPKNHKVIVYLEGEAEVSIPRDGQQGFDRLVDDQWLGRLFTSATVDLQVPARPLGGSLPWIWSRAQQALSKGAENAVRQVGFAQQMVISPQTGQLQTIEPATPTDSMDTFESSFGGLGASDQSGAQFKTITGEFQPVAASQQSGSAPQAFQTPRQNQAVQNGLSNQGNTRPPRAPLGSTDVNISARDSSGTLNSKSFSNPQNPNEWITVGVGGIRIVVDSDEIATLPQFQADVDRNLYILADNMVNWQVTQPDGSKRNQFYLEGNVVFGKGSRVIYADRMFYDVGLRQGTILSAELMTELEGIEGPVRLKADVVQQYNQNNLQAFGTAFTSSRLGVPRYWLQSESLSLQQVDGASFNQQTQRMEPESQFLLNSEQNRVFLGGVPVFGWPRLQTNLNDPTLYLDRIGINNDRIFGFQLTTGWNMYQLLGIQPPEGTKWVGLLDYLSDRGLGWGSEYQYERDAMFGYPGQVNGIYKSWVINDDGTDFLGLDRTALTPERNMRGRVILNHRHRFAPGRTLRAEAGYISDRNFLEQYYEREWDTEKDATTGLWYEDNRGNRSNNLTVDFQLNEFFTQTSGVQWDNFILGQPVFNNRVIWHSHTHAGYVRMRQAETPFDPVDAAKFDPLAWEADVDGFRTGTRHELDLPLQVGPVKVVPYGIGDVTYWQEDLTGNDLLRAYGQLGVRASMPMWRVDPNIRSVLWNVNGLAHKVTFDVDAFYADASQDLNELPLYDELDDDSQEHFRRRFAFDTFGIAPGGDTPFRFDERSFALRSGMQGNVTAPSSEIADDLMAVKLGLRQRWQTKRGLPGRERIIDWITLDMQTIFFPDSQRDNFGTADFGMLDYDFRWHIGDRFSIVSDGYADFFSQGLRTLSIGANASRPEVGNVYVGYRMIEGPISSNILSAALTYRMSDKWGVKAGGQVDFGETGTIGQTLSFVYIGESFLWQFGFNHDVSRDNVGFRFGIEPRFVKNGRLFRPGGTSIPPAGSRWLE